MAKAYVPVDHPGRTCGLARCSNLFKPRQTSQQFCSKRCADYRPFNRRPNRNCEVCLKSFQPKDNTQRTCGRTCGAFLSSQTNGTNRCSIWHWCSKCGEMTYGESVHRPCPIPRPRHTVRRPPRPYVRPHRDPLPTRICVGCGIEFQPKTNRQKYHDVPCADRMLSNHRSHIERVASRTGERIALWQIGDRDGWRCHLCGKHVDRTAPPNTLGAPTRDHLIPVSQGGEHTAVNVRLAHMVCNSRRHVDAVPAQLILV